MRALRFHRFGSLDELAPEEIARPELRAGEVVVHVRAASVNPSDVKNVAGKMDGTTLPRTPGRDFAGIVVAGPSELVGREVWGAGGEVGFTRDGTHAEFVALPVDGISRKPASLGFDEAAACGVNFVTAWSGVHDAIRLGAGETILVTGARGGVGSSVVQLARWMGARTIGVDRPRSGTHDDAEAALRPDVSVSTDDDVAGVVMRETAGRGVEAVFDTVGAPLMASMLAALAPGGRYAIIASVGDRRASFDVLDFYHKRLHLIGVDSRAIESPEAARILDRLRPGFERGALRSPRIAQRFDISVALDGYHAVANDAVSGKAVLTVDP